MATHPRPLLAMIRRECGEWKRWRNTINGDLNDRERNRSPRMRGEAAVERLNGIIR